MKYMANFHNFFSHLNRLRENEYRLTVGGWKYPLQGMKYTEKMLYSNRKFPKMNKQKTDKDKAVG